MRTNVVARMMASLIAAGMASLAVPAEAGSAAATASPQKAESVIGPSGLPVPRFVALKKSKVRGRFGPGFDYPVAAVYRKAGLPVRVVAETRDDVWRRVEDADGQKVWVHRSMLMANDNVVVQGDAVLRSKPDQAAAGRARLTRGVVGEVLGCEAGWCRLKAGEFKGWLPAASLWGAPQG